VKAVLWDVDDTLLETLPARMRALAHAYEVCVGSKTDPEALWRSHRGGTLEDLGKRLVGGDYHRFTTVYRDQYYGSRRDIRPFPGIEAVLESFLTAEVPMAVVTSKVAWGATEELVQVDLLKYFQAVVGFDDTQLHKPDPEPIYTAMERLCIDEPEDVVFIGDSPADIWAARNAGCTSVAATWGTLDCELLLDSTPTHIIGHPRELFEILGRSLVSP
jgi:pyrophosphatase PpaX